MAFWTSERMQQDVARLVVQGKSERVKQGAYELSLGREVYITGEAVKRRLSYNEQISIPPGQMALLLVEEWISIPDNVIGLISMKSSFKLEGLVNISGFHVDPGFEGHLVFSVYNAGAKPVPMTRGQPAFMLWLCDLTGPTRDLYSGKSQGQQHIGDEMVLRLQGQIASPAALAEQMKALHARLDRYLYWARVGLWVLGVGGSGFFVWWVQ